MGASNAAKASRDAAYDPVNKVLGVLRMNGELPWRMVLDLTRELDQWQTYVSAREARANMRDGYDEDRWLGQPYFPILIVEKDTMEPVCRPMASRWQMPFASSRGYGSLKLQHDVAELLKERRYLHGQTAIVYFISDHDPSGLDLQRACEQALENFGVRIAAFVRLALTPEQIRDPELDIERLAIRVKPSDSRSEKYVTQHQYLEDTNGEAWCWEVDVLPARVIEQALNEHIKSWINIEAWKRQGAEIEIARKLL